MGKSFDGSFHRANSHNLEIHTNTGDFVIMRFIHEYKDISRAGFTKANKEPSYKVSEVCDNLCRIMNIFNESYNLNKGAYNQLIDAYRPFLKNYMTYEMLQKRVEESRNTDGWLDA